MKRSFLQSAVAPILFSGVMSLLGAAGIAVLVPRQDAAAESLPDTSEPKKLPQFVSLLNGRDLTGWVNVNTAPGTWTVKDGLLVHGFDLGGVKGRDSELDAFERAAATLGPIAEETGITLVPITTNVRHLDDDVYFWMYEFHGAALAAVAHAFSNRLARAHIASSGDIPHAIPWGSHPVLDMNFGSANLQVFHDGLPYSRLQKVELLCGWDAALRGMRVCTMTPPDALNCGKCEKCVRTMLDLLAVGRLGDTQAFPVHDVSPDLLDAVLTPEDLKDLPGEYIELIEPLKAQGRPDLAQVIESKLAMLDKLVAWENEQDWKGAIKRFDRRILDGKLLAVYKWWLERVRQ